MLFTTSIRFLSASFRKIISAPVTGSKRLTSSPLHVYIRKNFPKQHKQPQEVLHRLSKRFSKLSKPKKAPYVKIAEANAKIIEKRRAVFSNVNITGYKLFTQRNMKKFFRKAKGNGFSKGTNAIKAIAKRWHNCRPSTKAPFNKEAAKIKAAALAKRAQLIRAYSK